MINRIILFFVVMTVVSCKTREVVTSEKNEEIDSFLKIEFKKELTSGDTFIFNVTNNSDDTLTILSPSVAFIEKLESKEWRRVKILYCPCGANCIAPPKEKILSIGQSHNYKWNLKESWCGEKQENGIPEIIEKEPQEGIYRIKVDYVYKGESEELIKQFEIENNNK